MKIEEAQELVSEASAILKQEYPSITPRILVHQIRIQKSIRVATANKFIEGLKIVDLQNWKAKYIEPEVCDGTKWSIEIITNERKISKHGDNKFPGEWDVFCKLMREITKRLFQQS